MTINGIDISSYQTGININGLGAALSAVVCKLTEYNNYVSTAFTSQYAQSKAAYKLRGIYHYAGSSVTKKIDNAVAEAKFFIEKAHPYIHDGILMLDWEPYGYGMSVSSEMEWVLEWADSVHSLTNNVWPVLYMDFNHVRMWDNANRADAKKVAENIALIVAGGSKYNNVQAFDPPSESAALAVLDEYMDVPNYWKLFGWQYTSRGNLNGYFPLDLNAYYVDAAQWHAYANPSGSPIPVPVKPHSPMHGLSVPNLIARGSNQYYGSYSGPNASHGGAIQDERPNIKLIQKQLIYLGFVPGIHDLNSPWADGIFDGPNQAPGTGDTSRAVAAFQRAHMIGDKNFGKVYWGEWEKLASL